jgi:hypothetical protein
MPAAGQSQSIRASITGGDGSGKCTFEVQVDGAAEVEIAGDRGTIRQLSGQPARWLRLTCNRPLPNNPGSFRFQGVDGRGRQQLVRDPNGSGGVAVIRIEDSKGGSERYTGDIEWRDGNDNWGGVGNWNNGRRANDDWKSRITPADAMRICKNQVMETRNVAGNRVTVSRGEMQRDGDSVINFTFRNANGVARNGTCTVSRTGQIVDFEVERGRNANRASLNQALDACQDEAARRFGVQRDNVRVQHGIDPGNGSYLVNFQVPDRANRIRTGTCRISPTGEIENFRM